MADNHLTAFHSQCQILVVDDDPSIRLLCSTSLKNAGYCVLEAQTSSEAMALFTASVPLINLLLIDLFLPPPHLRLRTHNTRYPHVNGHELIQQIFPLKKEIRALFMSSSTFESLPRHGIMIDPELFLQKPFSVEQLFAHVTAALAGPPITQPAIAAPQPAADIPWVD